VEFSDELKALVDEVANRVDRWTAQSAWIWEPGSPASAEIANPEVRQDGHAVGGPPGSHGVRIRADGDEAGGGVLAVRRAGHRSGPPGARH